jgi:rare lipoprotein A
MLMAATFLFLERAASRIANWSSDLEAEAAGERGESLGFWYQYGKECLSASYPKVSQGTASWYRHSDDRHTANMERFDPQGLTAAHINLPFGTLVRVFYKDRSVLVRINDRGPYVRGRDIDLTEGAVLKLGREAYQKGVVPVTLEILRLGPNCQPSQAP